MDTRADAAHPTRRDGAGIVEPHDRHLHPEESGRVSVAVDHRRGIAELLVAWHARFGCRACAHGIEYAGCTTYSLRDCVRSSELAKESFITMGALPIVQISTSLPTTCEFVSELAE